MGEAENEDKVKIAEQMAADADASANAAREKAHKAQDLANSVGNKLHDAKCTNNKGCANLRGYCCPTFDVAHYHLGDAPMWGENLGCCKGALEEEEEEEESLGTSKAASYDGLTLALSMLTSAAIGAMSAVAVVK